MELILKRHTFLADRTIGKLILKLEKEEVTFDVLEDVVRGQGDAASVDKWKVKGHSAIPYGSYQLRFTPSPKYGVKWQVMDVPGFQGIRIHAGNDPSHTEGCLLLGTYDHLTKKVLQSTRAVESFEKIMKPFETTINRITICK